MPIKYVILNEIVICDDGFSLNKHGNNFTYALLQVCNIYKLYIY